MFINHFHIKTLAKGFSPPLFWKINMFHRLQSAFVRPELQHGNDEAISDDQEPAVAKSAFLSSVRID